MAACRQSPLQSKLFHRSAADDDDLLRDQGFEETGLLISQKSLAKAQHGHWSEYIGCTVSIGVHSLFLVGSVCFFDNYPLWITFIGDWCFVIGSLLLFGIAACATHGSWVAGERSRVFSGFGSNNHYNEFVLHLNFLVSSIVFAAGSVLFMPGVYASRLNELWGHEVGAWCFISGSFGFVLASYWKAQGISVEHAKRKVARGGMLSKAETLCVQITSVGMCLSMIGGILFVTGSFLYRPGYEHTSGCGRSGQSQVAPPTKLLGNEMLGSVLEPVSEAVKQDERFTNSTETDGKISGTLSSSGAYAAMVGLGKPHYRQPLRRRNPGVIQMQTRHEWDYPSPLQKLQENPFCASTTQHGTWMYLIGSCCFLMQSVFTLACTIIMHGSEEPEKQNIMSYITHGRQQVSPRSRLSSSLRPSKGHFIARVMETQGRPAAVVTEKERSSSATSSAASTVCSGASTAASREKGPETSATEPRVATNASIATHCFAYDDDSQDEADNVGGE